MSSPATTKACIVGAYALAISSVLLTRVFNQYTLAEVMAVAAFLCGLALWRSTPSADRLILAGAVLGIGGLALKGLFVMLGVGVEHHDMATHETTPANPLLAHIHHLFFNIGFLCYLLSAGRLALSQRRAKI